MRTIKFRAWLKDEGEWVMTYDLAFDEFEPINDLLARVDNLMQFTGLKDKNGVEIYEGDCYFPDVGEKHIVVFRDGCFMGKNVFTKGTTPIIDGGICQVIGNIYQNGDLLK